MPYSSMMCVCVCMYTVNVSIKIAEEPGSDWKNPTKQPRPVLSLLKNLTSVCNETEILWVNTALRLPQGSRWMPGSVQQNILDNLDFSHVTGFQMDVRGEHAEILVSLLKASSLQIGVKICFMWCLALLKKSVEKLGSSSAVTFIKHAEWAFWEAADFIPRTCSSSSAVCMSACLSLQVNQACLAECVLLSFSIFVWWILLRTSFCVSGLSLSLRCPALLLVLQRTMLEKLSHFRNWELV